MNERKSREAALAAFGRAVDAVREAEAVIAKANEAHPNALYDVMAAVLPSPEAMRFRVREVLDEIGPALERETAARRKGKIRVCIDWFAASDVEDAGFDVEREKSDPEHHRLGVHHPAAWAYVDNAEDKARVLAIEEEALR